MIARDDDPVDGGALEDHRAVAGGVVHEAGGRFVRIDLRVAARSNRRRGVNARFPRQLQAVEPSSAEPGGAAAPMFAFEPRGRVRRRRVIDGVAAGPIAPDVELPDGPDDVARGGAAELPDATRTRFAVTVGELSIIGIRFQHQERRARGGAPAADARGVEERDARPRARSATRWSRP